MKTTVKAAPCTIVSSVPRLHDRDGTRWHSGRTRRRHDDVGYRRAAGNCLIAGEEDALPRRKLAGASIGDVLQECRFFGIEAAIMGAS